MDESKKTKTEKEKKKILTMLILIATLVICTTGATYAYFALRATNNTVTGTSATADLTLTVTQAELAIPNTGVIIPQNELTLASAMDSTNKCVDNNQNVICKVYTITIKNDSSASVRVHGTIQFSLVGTNVTLPNLKWKRVTDTTTLGTQTTGSYAGVSVGTIDTLSTTEDIADISSKFDLTTGTVCNNPDDVGCTDIALTGNGGTTTYYIVIWINETEDIQEDAGTWRGTITFNDESGTGITSTITS